MLQAEIIRGIMRKCMMKSKKVTIKKISLIHGEVIYKTRRD